MKQRYRKPYNPRATAYARKVQMQSEKHSSTATLIAIGIFCILTLGFCAAQIGGGNDKDNKQTPTPAKFFQTTTATAPSEPTTEEYAEPTTTSRKSSSLFAPLNEDDKKHYTPKPRTYAPKPPTYNEPEYTPKPKRTATKRSTGTLTVRGGTFCNGGAGVTKKGTPMVCAPGADGKNRWRKAG